MHLRRARALVGLLTLQAGLVAYSGARAARAFMEQSPTASETRVFTTPSVVLNTAPPPTASTATPHAMPGRAFVLEEIVDPWQPGRSLSRSAQDELVDPWRESRTAQDDSELIDPWRGDARVAGLDAPVAAYDWNTSPPELLNPWPAALAPLNYDLNDLIDPWSTRH